MILTGYKPRVCTLPEAYVKERLLSLVTGNINCYELILQVVNKSNQPVRMEDNSIKKIGIVKLNSINYQM